MVCDIGMLLFQSLAPYIANNSAHPFLAVDAAVPIVLCGDITQSIQFNMDCATGAILGNTSLDLIFTRNISVECLNDISYFSYHSPVLRQLPGLPSPNQNDLVARSRTFLSR
jgi:hypothetical protein